MEKIIAAIDGLKYSESTTQYAIHLAKLADAHLVGIFLEDFTYHSYKVYEVAGDDELSAMRRSELEDRDAALRQEAVEKFAQACRSAGIPFSMRKDRNIAIQELLHESIFADLLVIDRKETLTRYGEEVPTRFVRELLERVQCPVMVVPQEFRPIQRSVLLYDGEPGSVYAIKMFCNVAPALKQLPAEVVSVNTATQKMPDTRLMKEFMKRHFGEINYTTLKGIPESEIIRQIRATGGNAVVVLGAYRRGMMSRWFRASMADILMKELAVPLFIAHS